MDFKNINLKISKVVLEDNQIIGDAYKIPLFDKKLDIPNDTNKPKNITNVFSAHYSFFYDVNNYKFDISCSFLYTDAELKSFTEKDSDLPNKIEKYTKEDVTKYFSTEELDDIFNEFKKECVSILNSKDDEIKTFEDILYTYYKEELEYTLP